METVVAAPGCGPASDPAGITVGDPDGELASVELSLTTVPTGVQCIRLSAAPSSGAAANKNFAVTAGSASTNLQMDLLQPGNYTMSGYAFTVACDSISAATAAWVADPVPITLRAGAPTVLTMNFRKNSPINVNANFVNNVQLVSMSIYDTNIVTDQGVLRAGAASSPIFTRTNFAAFDGTLTPGNLVVAIAGAFNGACAVRADGTVWCWGINTFGELGPGIPIVSSSPTPVQVPGLSAATQISMGQGSTCVAATGSGGVGVYCFGDNTGGQLGNGSTVSTTTPVLAFAGLVKGLACGYFSAYVVTPAGAIRSWGSNTFGQLGDGTTMSRLTHGATLETTAVQTVVAGSFHACSLRADGSVHCWGNNGTGQIGDGSTTNATAPATVAGLVARQIVAGLDHTCAVNSAGQSICWGANDRGQIGDGSGINRLLPTPTSLGTVVVTSVNSTAGASANCAIASNFDVYCWGDNTNGRIGDGTLNNAFVPVRPILQ